MIMLRKIILFILTITLAVTCAAAETAKEYPKQKYDWDTLNVGNPTPLTGRFFTSMWGSSTSDLDVQELLHRYKLAVYDYDNVTYKTNPQVVAGSVQVDDAEGNRTYYFSLYDDLFYSDGTPVTAWDYAFSYLLTMDKAVRDSGGIPEKYEWLYGAEEYRNGEASSLKGVHVVDDRLIAITVKNDYLPYFYELARFRVSPYPRHVIAPDAELKDDGDGVYLTPSLSGELLRKNILDSYKGYMYCPSIVTGPYAMESYRGGKAYMVLNEYYKGDQYDNKPTIQHLVYGNDDVQEDIVQAYADYNLDVLNKLVRSDTVEDALKIPSAEEDPRQVELTSYPRDGLTVVKFNPNNDALQYEPVRKAIFYCMDRECLVKEYMNGTGLVLNGVYGVGSWILSQVGAEEDYPDYRKNGKDVASARDYIDRMKAWQEKYLSDMPVYELNRFTAKALLKEDGWEYDMFGDPYTGGIRYKKLKNGKLIPLKFKIAVPAYLRGLLEKHWVRHLEMVGVSAELIVEDIAPLADDYKRDSTIYDMVVVGEDFSDQFEFEGGFARLESLPGSEPLTSLEQLFARINESRREVYHTERSNVEGLVKKWLGWQKEIAETLPVLPIYSNVYFDISIPELEEYQVEDYWGWGNASIAAWFTYDDPEMEQYAAGNATE